MATYTHQFPADIGETKNNQPFMLLTSYESKNAIESVHTNNPNMMNNFLGIPLSSIALYIPTNSLRQTTDANWGGVEGGALKAGAMGAIGDITGLSKLIGLGDQGGTTGDAASIIGNVMSSVGMGATAGAAGAVEKATGMLSAGAGIAVNNHMAMAYKGPDKFRTHEFAFQFFPKNKDDAEDIRKIIWDFKNGMLPRMVGESLKNSRTLSKPFFRSPRHWEIDFFHVFNGKVKKNNNFLLDIKKSVITSMTVNHDPNSVVSLHHDGSPVQTNFSLTFQEIEFPISLDEGSLLKPAPSGSGDSEGDSNTEDRITSVSTKQSQGVTVQAMKYHSGGVYEKNMERLRNLK
jgi:hypothetical protein